MVYFHRDGRLHSPNDTLSLDGSYGILCCEALDLWQSKETPYPGVVGFLVVSSDIQVAKSTDRSAIEIYFTNQTLHLM